jgi:hypothetical protein
MENFSFQNLTNLPIEKLMAMRDTVDRAILAKQAGRFSLADKVEFQARRNEMLEGVVARVNTNTLTIVTAKNGRWRIPFELCHKINDAEEDE